MANPFGELGGGREAGVGVARESSGGRSSVRPRRSFGGPGRLVVTRRPTSCSYTGFGGARTLNPGVPDLVRVRFVDWSDPDANDWLAVSRSG
jgi:hypothetical protein